jgi:hypothetical protein
MSSRLNGEKSEENYPLIQCRLSFGFPAPKNENPSIAGRGRIPGVEMEHSFVFSRPIFIFALILRSEVFVLATGSNLQRSPLNFRQSRPRFLVPPAKAKKVRSAM